MALVSWLLRMVLVAGAALLGNYVGNFVRDPRASTTGSDVGLVRTADAAGTVVGVRVTLTNFLPALVLAWFAGPPRTLAAFLSGAVVSALLGDSLEPKP